MPRVAMSNAGQVAGDHPAVEDHGGIGATLVGLEELDDRVSAGLLLAVAREAHVDRKLARPRQRARGGQQQVQLSLVVCHPAAVQVLAADLGLERRRLPQLERIGRLDVEVAVAEDGGRALGVARRRDLTDRERRSVPVDQLALSAGVADRAQTHSPARPRPPRRAGSALIDWILRNSASSSNQSARRERIDSAQYTAGTNVCSSIGGRM